VEWHDAPGISTVYTYSVDATDAQYMFNGSTYTGGAGALSGRNVIGFMYNGTVKGYVQGSKTLDTSASATLGSLNTIFIGSMWNLTNSFNGKISELIIYSAALSFSHYGHYRTYAAAKWGGV
jgi:hypothetical protein